MAQSPTAQPHRKSRGFQQTAGLIRSRVSKASESRGFAVAKVLTHWAEVAGPDIARIARPVNVSYGRKGFGATLTLLTTGAQAPMLEMQKEKLRERVNACYGYAAISRIKITQTAPTGFAEGQVAFEPKPQTPKGPTQAQTAKAAAQTQDVADDGLRAALAALGQNIYSKSES